MGKIDFKEIGEQDIESYHQLRLQGLQQHPEAFGETPERFIQKSFNDIATKLNESKKNGGFILGAFAGDLIVGTVALGRENGEKSSHRGMLWGMYVLPDYRNQKVGLNLVELLLNKAQNVAGLEQIHLAVTVGNAAAKRVYEKLGFNVYGTDPKVLKVGPKYHDEFLMVKHLQAG